MATFDFTQLQQLVESAEATAAAESSIRKALVRIENYQDSITKEIHSIYSMLDGNLPAPTAPATTTNTRAKRGAVERDAEAPYGRKKNGEPMLPRGRGAAKKAADNSGTGELELATTPTAPTTPTEEVEEKTKPVELLEDAELDLDLEHSQESAEDIASRLEATVKPASKPTRAPRGAGK